MQEGLWRNVEAGEAEEPLLPGVGDRLGGRLGHGDAEVIAAEGEEPPAVTMGEQTEVADTDEAVGQDVEQRRWFEIAIRWVERPR